MEGPTPGQVTLSSLVTGVAGDVAVDRSGDLWVPNAGNNVVIGFAKSQLAKSGPQAARRDRRRVGDGAQLALGCSHRALGARLRDLGPPR